MPKYRVITYGCQMNRSDSERAEALLRGVGFEPTERDEEADLILVNTCSVRQTAEDRVYGLMRRFAEMKERNPRLMIAVMGCMAGRDKDGKIRSKLPTVDFFFPTSRMTELPRWIAERDPHLLKTADTPEDYLKIMPMRKGTRQAYLTIQTGCDKFCSYCVVPFARGLPKDRPFADVIGEARELIAGGCVEITLLGQAVNAWKAPDPQNFSAGNPFKDSFAALLWELDRLPGLERFHYTAPHPLHVSEEGIEAMTLPKHVRFVHLPAQAGSSAVLKRMNRRYAREDYLGVISRIKERIPDIAIGTDLIVGFPGETAEQFEETVSLYREVGFDISYTAQYSPRSGTASWRAFPDDVSREEKKRRWEVMQKLMEETVLERNRALVGRTVRVLIDSVDSKGVAEGNCEYMKRVRFRPTEGRGVGAFEEVTIERAREWVLYGRGAA